MYVLPASLRSSDEEAAESEQREKKHQREPEGFKARSAREEAKSNLLGARVNISPTHEQKQSGVGVDSIHS